MTKVHHLVGRTAESVQSLPEAEKDRRRYANQYGLSRKVGSLSSLPAAHYAQLICP